MGPSPNSNGGIALLDLMAFKMHWPIDAYLSREASNDFLSNFKDGGKMFVLDSKSFIVG